MAKGGILLVAEIGILYLTIYNCEPAYDFEKTKAFGVVSWRRKRDLNPRPHA